MIMESGAEGADNFFDREFFPPPNTGQMMTFSEQPRRADPKNPIFIVC